MNDKSILSTPALPHCQHRTPRDSVGAPGPAVYIRALTARRLAAEQAVGTSRKSRKSLC